MLYGTYCIYKILNIVYNLYDSLYILYSIYVNIVMQSVVLHDVYAFLIACVFQLLKLLWNSVSDIYLLLFICFLFPLLINLSWVIIMFFPEWKKLPLTLPFSHHRLILPYERFTKGEEDKPLPPAKPRKQEAGTQEAGIKTKVLSVKRPKEEQNCQSRNEKDADNQVSETVSHQIWKVTLFYTKQ